MAVEATSIVRYNIWRAWISGGLIWKAGQVSVYIQLRSHINLSARVLAPCGSARNKNNDDPQVVFGKRTGLIHANDRQGGRGANTAKREAITIPVQRLLRPKGRSRPQTTIHNGPRYEASESWRHPSQPKQEILDRSSQVVGRTGGGRHDGT